MAQARQEAACASWQRQERHARPGGRYVHAGDACRYQSLRAPIVSSASTPMAIHQRYDHRAYTSTKEKIVTGTTATMMVLRLTRLRLRTSTCGICSLMHAPDLVLRCRATSSRQSGDRGLTFHV